jgi:tetratricopeptide (TPR) repeat protein
MLKQANKLLLEGEY